MSATVILGTAGYVTRLSGGVGGSGREPSSIPIRRQDSVTYPFDIPPTLKCRFAVDGVCWGQRRAMMVQKVAARRSKEKCMNRRDAGHALVLGLLAAGGAPFAHAQPAARCTASVI